MAWDGTRSKGKVDTGIPGTIARRIHQHFECGIRCQRQNSSREGETFPWDLYMEELTTAATQRQTREADLHQGSTLPLPRICLYIPA